jgi:hypothetical protein
MRPRLLRTSSASRNRGRRRRMPSRRREKEKTLTRDSRKREERCNSTYKTFRCNAWNIRLKTDGTLKIYIQNTCKTHEKHLKIIVKHMQHPDKTFETCVKHLQHPDLLLQLPHKTLAIYLWNTWNMHLQQCNMCFQRNVTLLIERMETRRCGARRRRGGQRRRMDLAAARSSSAGNSPEDVARLWQETRVQAWGTRRSHAARCVKLRPIWIWPQQRPLGTR